MMVMEMAGEDVLHGAILRQAEARVLIPDSPKEKSSPKSQKSRISRDFLKRGGRESNSNPQIEEFFQCNEGVRVEPENRVVAVTGLTLVVNREPAFRLCRGLSDHGAWEAAVARVQPA